MQAFLEHRIPDFAAGTRLMTDLFKLSDKIIREGVANEPVNRVNFELSEIANGIRAKIYKQRQSS